MVYRLYTIAVGNAKLDFTPPLPFCSPPSPKLMTAVPNHAKPSLYNYSILLSHPHLVPATWSYDIRPSIVN